MKKISFFSTTQPLEPPAHVYLFNNKGFSYLEIAISLLIIGILATGGTLSLSAITNANKLAQAREQLNETKQVLLAYAKLHEKLPFVDIDTDGKSDEGERGDISIGQTPGYLPFETLGLPVTDPWGNRIRYAFHSATVDCAIFKAALLQTNGIEDTSAFPQVLETDIVSLDPSTWVDDATWSVAFVIASGGATDGDVNGSIFDTYVDPQDGTTVIADNQDGSPRFVRAGASGAFDDLTVYVGEYLYVARACPL